MRFYDKIVSSRITLAHKNGDKKGGFRKNKTTNECRNQ